MNIKTPEVDGAYAQATADSDEKVAQIACLQTGWRGGVDGIRFLFHALTNASPKVRLQASSSLIQLGVADERVVSTLKEFPPDVVKEFDKASQDAAEFAEIMGVKDCVGSFADLLNKAQAMAKANSDK